MITLQQNSNFQAGVITQQPCRVFHRFRVANMRIIRPLYNHHLLGGSEYSLYSRDFYLKHEIRKMFNFRLWCNTFTFPLSFEEYSALYAGEVAQPSSDSPADVQGAATNSQSLDSLIPCVAISGWYGEHIADDIKAKIIGQCVKIKSIQPHRGGAPKFPNRVGTIISIKPAILETGRPFFEVRLNPTNRAAERTELFYSRDFDFLSDSVAVQAVQDEQPTPKGFMQTLLDGVYDVATQISLPFKKPKQAKTPISAPVQLTLFELLQPYAIEQFNKMQALLQAYKKDFAELKNPQSRLFKMLGTKAQKRLADLEDKVRVLRRDISFHFLCWELPQRLWVVV